MTENLAHPGEGARPPPFTISSITDKVVVYAPAESRYAPPPISTLVYPYMYSVRMKKHSSSVENFYYEKGNESFVPDGHWQTLS